MSEQQDDYEIIGGFWWSDLTDTITCEAVTSELQTKVEDITNQLKTAWEKYQDTGVQTNHVWRANARKALAMTKGELRRVQVRQKELKLQSKAQNFVINGGMSSEEAQAKKLERIAAANARNESELHLFKEEVKRRLPPAEYDDIWRTVRAEIAARTPQAA